jgi:hypothetical protein
MKFKSIFIIFVATEALTAVVKNSSTFRATMPWGRREKGGLRIECSLRNLTGSVTWKTEI